MIATRHVKRLIAPVLLVAVAALALAGLRVGAQLLLSSATGARAADALSELPELPPEADRLVTWAPDAWTEDRHLEPATRRLVEAAYVRAWAALGRYGAHGDAEGVGTWFSGPAKAAVLAQPAGEGTGTWSLGHRLELRFYALDGATVALRDVGAELVRASRSPAGEVVTDTRERYDVVMVLEDGYWRVRQLRRVDAEPTVAVVRVDDRPATTTVVSGLEVPAARRDVPPMHATGYQPAGEAGTSPWLGLDELAVGRDLDTVRRLGLDAVRVRLPFDALGGGAPEPTALQAARRLLDLAGDRGLRVVLVLFDGRHDHGPATWAADDRHLDGVVPALAGHPALAMWDLADAPDLDDGVASSATEGRAWLVHMTAHARALDPATPLTVAWASAAAATDPGVGALLDAVGLRWSGAADELPAAVADIRAAVGDKPVLLASYGLSTWNSWFPGGHTEAEQAAAVADTLAAARRVGVTTTIADALRDPLVPPVPSRLPWKAGPPTGVGLLRADGTAKAAAELVRPGADLGSVARPGPLERLHKPFWQAIAVLVVAAASATVLRGRLRGILRDRRGRRRARRERRRSARR